jgi:Holliday junction resolvasome RuvABC DNA-binding subunit
LASIPTNPGKVIVRYASNENALKSLFGFLVAEKNTDFTKLSKLQKINGIDVNSGILIIIATAINTCLIAFLGAD